jgi:hypothetical protein
MDNYGQIYQTSILHTLAKYKSPGISTKISQGIMEATWHLKRYNFRLRLAFHRILMIRLLQTIKNQNTIINSISSRNRQTNQKDYSNCRIIFENISNKKRLEQSTTTSGSRIQ